MEVKEKLELKVRTAVSCGIGEALRVKESCEGVEEERDC